MTASARCGIIGIIACLLVACSSSSTTTRSSKVAISHDGINSNDDVDAISGLPARQSRDTVAGTWNPGGAKNAGAHQQHQHQQQQRSSAILNSNGDDVNSEVAVVAAAHRHSKRGDRDGSSRGGRDKDREHQRADRHRAREKERGAGYVMSNSTAASAATLSTKVASGESGSVHHGHHHEVVAATTQGKEAFDAYDDDDDDEDEEEEKKEADDAHDVSRYTTSRSRHQQQKGQQQQQQYSYVRSNCSRCRMMEETIKLTKEAIKQQILNKLGLRQAPNITGRTVPQIPPLNRLLDHYGMQGDAPGSLFKPGPVFEEALDDYHAKTERVITFAQPPPAEWNISEKTEVQYFKFSHAVMTNKVMRASLWLYISPSKVSEDGAEPVDTNVAHLLHVYKVMRSDHSKPVHSHVHSMKVEVKPHRGMWITLDAKKLVNEWFRNPQANFGIVVQAFDRDGHQLIVTNTNSADANSTLFPFVEVHMTDESKRRTKRMIGLNCEENSKEVRCCRYPLTVDFEEFGWDWIIAPKKYEANYCSGECPFVFLQKYPHTHLVQQANPSGSAGPCCAPRKMSSISMLYFDQELNIIYGLLPGMVVDRCGCS